MCLCTASIVLATDRFHHGHVQQQVIREKVVEFNSDYALGYDGYMDQAEKLVADREELNASTIKDLIDIVKTLIELKKEIGPILPRNNPTTPTPPADPVPEAPRTSSLEDKVVSIFNKYKCVTCHNYSKPSGKLNLEDITKLDVFSALAVYDRTEGRALRERGLTLMPLSGDQVAEEDVTTLKLWLMDLAEKR